jgi:5'-3' exonuclease
MTTLIVDGNNLAHRCKHAFQLSYKMEDVSVVYGFIRVLTADAEKLGATSIIVCWDGGIPDHRRELIPEYKANRSRDWAEEERDAFYGQVNSLRRVLPSMGVVSLKEKGIEADDLMFQASRIIEDDCIIHTSDADLLQSVTPDGRVKIYHAYNERMISWDNFVAEVGVQPYQYLDYKAMMGDSSDNIRGVPGIGDKLAKAILDAYGSADAAIEAIEAEEEWQASKLAHTRLSKVDAGFVDTIRRVVDLSSDSPDVSARIRNDVGLWKPYRDKTVKMFMLQKGFKSMLDGKVYVKQVFSGMRKPQLYGEVGEGIVLVVTHS